MHVLFYGQDGASAKVEASRRRAAALPNKIEISAAHSIACRQIEDLPELVTLEFMPDVSAHERDRLEKIFGKSAGPSIPPPPPSVDPLSRLPNNWRTLKLHELRDTAAAVSGGRMPETKDQAVTMIEAAFTARRK